MMLFDLHLLIIIVVRVQRGTDDVKKHQWFSTIVWDDVFDRKLEVGLERDS